MLAKILCVDDDPITLMLYKMVVRKSGFAHEIETARNGEEALQFFDKSASANTNYPEIIFLDLNMPVMGGWEFLDHFSTEKYSSYSEVKVIVLSSTIDPHDIEKAKTYPMVIDFQSKPISKEMLENIKNLL
ncbi:MAG: response regulator [Flavobacterium sp.]|nr:response regulator [Flavobacterium sp.]